MSLGDLNHSLRFFLFVVLSLALSTACSKQQKPAETQTQAQKTFASPDDAAKALVDAAKSGNREALLAIFGPESKDIIYSGDTAADTADFAGFVSDYDVMHRWRKLDNSSDMLITGADNKSFPIPLKKNDAGQWTFDTAAGKQEILTRRIGRNELAAIDVCAAVADAQKEYFSQTHDGVKQYAEKLISDEGKQNGLYWPPVEGQPPQPTRAAGGLGLVRKSQSQARFASAFPWVLLSNTREARIGCDRRCEELHRQRHDDGWFCGPRSSRSATATLES